MKSILTLIVFLSCTLLSGCIYKIDIQQGNIIKPAQVKRIHRGMSKLQVEQILGTPIMKNIFDRNRMIYIYTFQPGGGRMTKKDLIVFFRNGRVTHYTTDYRVPK